MYPQKRTSRKKPRLELAIYSRQKQPGTYHWALFVSSKSSKTKPVSSATKRHVKNTLQNIDGELRQPWRYENVQIPDCTREPRLLVRVVIGKILIPDQALERIVKEVPVCQPGNDDQLSASTFDCQSWVRDVVEVLGTRKAVVLHAEWHEMVDETLKYVAKKKLQSGLSGNWEGHPGPPMLDLFRGVEIVP